MWRLFIVHRLTMPLGLSRGSEVVTPLGRQIVLDNRARPGSMTTNAVLRRSPNSATTLTTAARADRTSRVAWEPNENHAGRLMSTGVGE